MTWVSKGLFALVLAAAAPMAAADFANVCGIGVPGDRFAGVDDDRDSVPDSEDWCPETAPDTPVGSNGCADWEVPVKCKARAAAPEPSATPAAPTAPTADTDGDGVADPADQCSGTPAGMAVDATGCVDIGKVVLKGVSFELGSATLRPEASETLRTVATAMKASPKVAVEIGGHTDSIGPADKNQRLSQRRAEAVRRFLAGEGVDAARLTAKGHGEDQPVDDNQTEAGRANNRRVEFKVTSP